MQVGLSDDPRPYGQFNGRAERLSAIKIPDIPETSSPYGLDAIRAKLMELFGRGSDLRRGAEAATGGVDSVADALSNVPRDAAAPFVELYRRGAPVASGAARSIASGVKQEWQPLLEAIARKLHTDVPQPPQVPPDARLLR